MSHSPSFRQLVLFLQMARRQNCQTQGKALPVPKAGVQWKRRKFTKSILLAGGAALASNGLYQAQKAISTTVPHKTARIAVIGGGMAGLNAAYQLQKQGFTATVYEASDRLGGRIRSVTGAVGPGIVSELGGQFINSDHADILDLVQDFGLTLFNRREDEARFPIPSVAYYFEGIHRPEAEIAEKLRPLAEQIAADSELLDQNFDRFAPFFDRLSVMDYLNAHADKIPEPFIRRLVENTIRTEYGVEPSFSSALQLIFLLPVVDGTAVDLLSYSDEIFLLQGGNQQLITGLAQALSGQIQIRKALTQIQSLGSGFRLTFSSQEVVDVDYVIIAIPFTILRNVDIRVNLPGRLKQFINGVNLGFNEKILAGFNQRAWRQGNGFTGEIWTDLGFAEAWDSSQAQTDRVNAELTFFTGGNQVLPSQIGSPQLQGQRFVSLLQRAIPGLQAAANGNFIRTAWSRNPFSKGAYTNFQPGQLTRFGGFLYVESDDPSQRQVVNVGNLAFAGEHLSDEFYGFINGAAQTGRLAAEVIMGRIQNG